MEIKEIIRCTQCGAALDLSLAEDGLVPCRYCGQKIPIAKESTPPSALYYLRIGDSNLYDCKFDSAYSAYEKAAGEAPEEHTAYFGMALSAFRVQYLNDEVSGRIQPICHEISRRVFTQDANYLRALSLANEAQRAEYERQGAQIDYIREQFYKIQATGLDYDCFICVKVTDDLTGGRTMDSIYAESIYNQLKLKGYVPFYSEKEIKDKTGGDYEAHILYALYTSECMLVVCSDERWLRTPWVKNEYTRFLKMINDSEKESDSLTILFSGEPVERLPGREGKIQGIKIGAERGTVNELEQFRITDFVEKHTPESRRKREEAAAEKERREKEYAEQQRLINQQIAELRQSAAKGAGGASVTVNSLMGRAGQEAATGNFERAEDYYNKVLDISPEYSQAWLGLFYTENKTTEEKGLNIYTTCQDVAAFDARYKANMKLKERFGFKYFNMALEYADEEKGEKLRALKADTEKRIAEGNAAMAEQLLMIAQQKISAKNFDVYAECNSALRVHPNNAYAYWLKFLADAKAPNEEYLLSGITIDMIKKILDGNNYVRALELAGAGSQYAGFNERLRQKVVELKSNLQEQAKETREFLGSTDDSAVRLANKSKYESDYISIKKVASFSFSIAALIAALVCLGLMIWCAVAEVDLPMWMVWGFAISIFGFIVEPVVYGAVCGVVICLCCVIICAIINASKGAKNMSVKNAKKSYESLNMVREGYRKSMNYLNSCIECCNSFIKVTDLA